MCDIMIFIYGYFQSITHWLKIMIVITQFPYIYEVKSLYINMVIATMMYALAHC